MFWPALFQCPEFFRLYAVRLENYLFQVQLNEPWQKKQTTEYLVSPWGRVISRVTSVHSEIKLATCTIKNTPEHIVWYFRSNACVKETIIYIAAKSPGSWFHCLCGPAANNMPSNHQLLSPFCEICLKFVCARVWVLFKKAVDQSHPVNFCPKRNNPRRIVVYFNLPLCHSRG